MNDYSLLSKQLEEIMDDMIEKLQMHGYTVTPPPAEPKFKPGDYVEVRDNDSEDWTLGRFTHVDDEGKYCTDNIESWKHCRHAPTWINWETGEIPGVGEILVQWSSDAYSVSTIASGSALKNKIKRWARLPGVE